MTEQPACLHSRVLSWWPQGRSSASWHCAECQAQFVPLEAAQKGFADVEPDAYAIALDGIAGTMSAVLFDYSERMNEKYGLTPQDMTFKTEKQHDCEADGHDRDDNGICWHCGNSLFLGADKTKDD